MDDFKREWLEKDYYKILGVDRTASQKDITKAYRKLARKYHPDSNSAPGAEAKFKEVSAANNVLGDPKTRQSYDEAQKLGMFQAGPGRSAGPGTGPGPGPGGIHFETDDLRQNLGGFFSRGGGGSTIFNFGRDWPKDGENVRAEVTISFDDAIKGTQISVTNPQDAAKPAVKVRIPPLVKDGALVRAKGRGMPGSRGGQNGDLLVRVKVEPHPVFERDQLNNLNLMMRQPISYTDAVLGGNIAVTTYAGDTATIAIAPGTQSGQRLRLRNKGLKRTSKNGADTTGDLFVEVQIEVPDVLTAKQRQAVEALAEAFAAEPDKRQKRQNRQGKSDSKPGSKSQQSKRKAGKEQSKTGKERSETGKEQHKTKQAKT